MLRRVAMADDRLPVASADAHLVSLDDAPVGERKFGHERGVAVVAADRRHGSGLVGRQAVFLEHRENRVAGIARGGGAHRVGGEIFALRGPHLHTETLADPLGVAGVEMWTTQGEYLT